MSSVSSVSSIKNPLAALRQGFTYPIRDALWGHIYLTPALAELANSAPFMRLYRIFQLGPAYCVYPGATHTRASHSLGVYHLSHRLLTNLAERGAAAWLSAEGVFSFLCAALLHDLGHFPYTHSLKELALESHEALTGKLILTEPVKSLAAAAGADPAFAAAIVDKTLPDGGNGELRFYRELLSGALDPDKLDYLNRDARYCGVPYGAQDVDFIFSRLLPHRDRGVDIDSRGIPSVESILFSKYLMYRAVYWHRQVRSATAMIKKALLAGLKAGVISGECLYNLDDQGLFTLMGEKAFPPFRLAGDVRNGRLYREILSFPFDEAEHGPLKDIEGRSGREEALAAELSNVSGIAIDENSVIIDLPEPVSFETGLFVRDENRYFRESTGALKEETVRAFAKSLRIVRVFAARPVENCELLLKNKTKWLY
ncbi:MAG: HD domain-containing protein [Treponema sp.]|nr:HD domain-containing protein [Treponema sp.]